MADRHQAGKSKYTADRQIPGSFEGETVTRRRFMNLATNGAGAVAVAAFTLPALGFAIGPIFSRVPINWHPIGPPSDFTTSTYATRIVTIVQGIGEPGKSIAYVRARNPQIDTDKLPKSFEYEKHVALSTRCMHLGCPIHYVDAAQRFICPCHGGVYDFRGFVVGGPPVRPLDRFYTRVRNGQVQIGPRYSVNAELERFSPRDPGEPLDGIGQYLYPSRPSVRKLGQGQP